MSPSYVASFENVIYPIPEGEQVAKLTLGENSVELSVGELMELLGLGDKSVKKKMRVGNDSDSTYFDIPSELWARMINYSVDKKTTWVNLTTNALDAFLMKEGF
jgi:hypothetical protein